MCMFQMVAILQTWWQLIPAKSSNKLKAMLDSYGFD